MPAKVLVIGGGGREHCLCWKLAQSQLVQEVYSSPGNGGITAEGFHKVELNVKCGSEVAKWCKTNNIDLVVVGPEDPLAAGVIDELKKHDIAAFGPSAMAAQIEASKSFAKSFMDRHQIPTARWKSFTDFESAKEHIETAEYPALVVKASGLAAGKGVVVAKDKDEAIACVEKMLIGQEFGSAGDTVVVEELLEGPEVSLLAFSDGKCVKCMPVAQDHKRLKDGDQGPNTGGMGAYAPCGLLSAETLSTVEETILLQTVKGMAEEGMPYVGVLYAGLMLTKDGPKVLEFNCRFGDPETQVLLPLLSSDLYLVMKKCVEGTLDTMTLQWKDEYAVGVVLASEGYPGSYQTGKVIEGLDAIDAEKRTLIFHAGTKVNDGGAIITDGGRVLTVVSVDRDLAAAAFKARQVAESKIKFDGKFHRKDIAEKGIKSGQSSVHLTYKDSGVDIAAGDHLVESISTGAKSTSRPGCSVQLGGFGGLCDLKAAGFKDPLLVSGTDGVGTKLKIAQSVKKHDTIGIDLVAMCVNDILCHGAEPLFFLDYFATGHLNVGTAQNVISGIVEGCKMAGCSLIGGETAEMPGMYADDEYDLAGFAVGAVERDDYLPSDNHAVAAGDIVIGLMSSGIHSNGLSMVRRLAERWGFTYDMSCPWDSGKSLGEALLVPTKIYTKAMKPLLKHKLVKAAAHVTGGGLLENIPRVLPTGLGVQLDASNWTIPSIFRWIRDKGNVETEEMARTFNLGIGMVVIVAPEHSTDVLEKIVSAGDSVQVIGTVVKVEQDEDTVCIKDLHKALDVPFSLKHRAEDDALVPGKRVRTNNGSSKKKRVAVLISGTGTNLQALINATQTGLCPSAEIALVISNKPDALGLKKAEAANIPTKVLCHKDYKSREEFDAAITGLLVESNIDLICLAGFMRILSGTFVTQWKGKLLNIHPSLLPSFKGIDAHKQVLAAGVRVTGCTVHFVSEEVDAGAIIWQETVPVNPGDTEIILMDRVKYKEHIAYPEALERVASQRAQLKDGKVVWT